MASSATKIGCVADGGGVSWAIWLRPALSAAKPVHTIAGSENCSMGNADCLSHPQRNCEAVFHFTSVLQKRSIRSKPFSILAMLVA